MWTVTISVIDEGKEKARVRATRIDPISDEVYNYECTAILSTPAQRAALLQRIKDQFIEHEARQGRIENFLSGLANTATNALNDWENNG